MSISKLREYTLNGLKELSEHPVKYTYSSVKDFAKDYWDLGIAITGGVIWQGDFLGSWNEPGGMLGPILYFGGSLAGGLEKNESVRAERIGRNFLAATSLIFFENNERLLGILSASGSIYGEIERRAKNSSLKSLEKIDD